MILNSLNSFKCNYLMPLHFKGVTIVAEFMNKLYELYVLQFSADHTNSSSMNSVCFCVIQSMFSLMSLSFRF